MYLTKNNTSYAKQYTPLNKEIYFVYKVYFDILSKSISKCEQNVRTSVDTSPLLSLQGDIKCQ